MVLNFNAKFYQSFVIKNNLWNIETPFLKSILKKCSHFCHSFANVSGLVSHFFLHNHVTVTWPLSNFCSSNKNGFFFWEIIHSISLFLRFHRHYLLLCNIWWIICKHFILKSISFCWSENFRGRKRHSLATICIFGNRQQEVLIATPYTHIY